MVLDNLGSSLYGALKKVFRATVVDEATVKELVRDIQRALLQADVNVKLVLGISKQIEERALKEKVPPGISRREHVIKVVYEELTRFVGDKPVPIKMEPGKKKILMLVGIQGSGKTTTIGKLARFYKNKGYKVAALTTDTYRPGAYEQLVQLTNQIDVKCFGNPEEKNAIKIAVKETKKAINGGYDIILVDTAGRHKEEKELMLEMQKIESALKPNEVILVIDGTLGQLAYSQAEEFAKATNIGSIIVTKLDGTAKGGGALSACAATNQSIRFIGIGEKIDEFDEFDPTSFVGTLLGVPDIEGLVKKVQEAEVDIDPEMAKRMMRGKFTLDDLYYQLKSIKKVGKMKNILAMVGGGNIPDALKDDAERNLEKWEIVLNSMTKEEKENPKIIKKTRKRRIAIGSGSDYSTINRMLDQYNQMKKFMKRFLQMQKKGKGMPGIPGMGKGMSQFLNKMGKDFKFS